MRLFTFRFSRLFSDRRRIGGLVLAAALLMMGAKESNIAPPMRPEGLPAFERKIEEVYQRVSASTVAIFTADGQSKGSGVIIDPKGLVLTHGHHLLEPGAA